MAYDHIYVIPDTLSAKGGDFYDRYGNLSYFADVSGLADKTQGGYDITSTVKAHTREHFMRDPAPSNVDASTRFASYGVRQTKGAVPGYTVYLQSGTEKREFQYTGTMAGLLAWLKDNAIVIINMYGPSGTPYDPIPVATQSNVALRA